MKKNLLLAIAMLLSLASFAQKKGDMFIAGEISTNFGFFTTSSSEDGYATTEKEPYATWLAAGVKYGYFVADNWKLGLAASVPFQSYSYDSSADNEKFKSSSVSLCLNPNVSYYVKLAEKFYYTPEFGVSFQRCKETDKLASKIIETSHYKSLGVYLDFLALEYKVSDRFSISTYLGSIEWRSTKYSYEDTDIKEKIKDFYFSLNDASVYFKFYF